MKKYVIIVVSAIVCSGCANLRIANEESIATKGVSVGSVIERNITYSKPEKNKAIIHIDKNMNTITIQNGDGEDLVAFTSSENRIPKVPIQVANTELRDHFIRVLFNKKDAIHVE